MRSGGGWGAGRGRRSSMRNGGRRERDNWGRGGCKEGKGNVKEASERKIRSRC